MSEDLSRISMTLPPDLLAAFDEVVEGWDYASRSGAMRDALRSFLTEYRTETGFEGTQRGSIVVQYDHHEGDVSGRIVELQHEFEASVVAVQHVHLSHRLCMETLAVDGSASAVRELANRLRSLGGVRQVRVAVVDASSPDADPDSAVD